MAQESEQMEVGIVRDLRSKFAPPCGCFAAVRRHADAAPPPNHQGLEEGEETSSMPPEPTPDAPPLAGQRGGGLVGFGFADDEQ